MTIYQTEGWFQVNLFYIQGEFRQERLGEVIHFFKSHRINQRCCLVAEEEVCKNLEGFFDFDIIQSDLELPIPPKTDALVLYSNASEFIHRFKLRTQPNTLWIDLDAITYNYDYFDGLVGDKVEMIPVVKANAQGSGLIRVGKHFESLKVPYQAVADVDEGVLMREAGIDSRIMVLQPSVNAVNRLVDFDLDPVVSSMDILGRVLQEVSQQEKCRYSIHLKLETGLNVTGFGEEEMEELVKFLNQNSQKLKVETVLSHLSSSEDLSKKNVTHSQVNRFEKMKSMIEERLLDKPFYHLLNTCGVVNFPNYTYHYCRFGKGWQGYTLCDNPINQRLKPVATLKTTLSQIRTINPGEWLGYSQVFKIEKVMKVGIAFIGFSDFFSRAWSKDGYVFINNKSVKILGTICMNALLIDLENISCQIGDSVEIFGENINVQEIAKSLKTLPSEVLSSVSERVDRVYFSRIL